MGEMWAEGVTHYKSLAGTIMLEKRKFGNGSGAKLGTGGEKSKR